MADDDIRNEIEDFNFEEEGSAGGDVDPFSDEEMGRKTEETRSKESEEHDFPEETEDDTPYLSKIGDTIQGWMAGQMSAKPEEVKQLGDDLAMRMNWYLAFASISMLEAVPDLMKNKRSLERKIYSEAEGSFDAKEIMSYHSKMTSELKDVLEFVRKFIKENKDYLTDNSDFFDRQLFEQIKAMNTDLVRDYLTFFRIVDAKGHNFLKELIKKYSKDA